MFDIGFSELLLVGLIALLVFGPERLPKVAREAALWIRKARALVSSVKQEIDHELHVQELKESLVKERREMDRMLMLEKKDNRPEENKTKPASPETDHE